MEINFNEPQFSTKEEAVRYVEELHKLGFNCAQCVACALAPFVKLDASYAFSLMEGFGAGMGNKTEVCGALSGAAAIYGFVKSNGIEQRGSKLNTYRCVDSLLVRFKEKIGSTNCADIKGIATGIPLCSCDECIAEALLLVLDELQLLDESK